MFVSFCMHYAGIDPQYLPIESTAYRIQMAMLQLERFVDKPTEYQPQCGDLIYFDTDGDTNADRIAIVCDVFAANGNTPATIMIVEGDTAQNDVSVRSFELTDPLIIGYTDVTAAHTAYLAEHGETQLPETEVSGSYLAQTVVYDPSLLQSENRFVFYTEQNGAYFALDGEGIPTPVTVDENGCIYAEVEDPQLLIWTLTYDETFGFFAENGNTGVMLAVIPQETEQGTRFILDTGISLYAAGGSDPITYQIAVAAAASYTVWLDGTDGGLMSLAGSDNLSYTVTNGSFTLPTTWDSPDKYSYVLQGWVDIKNYVYYRPGETVTVTDNMVFYADWKASTYDVGQFNADVTDTISTNDFITTHVFDYNALFNLYSESASVSVSSSSHSETWSVLWDTVVPFGGAASLEFIFRDWDAGGSNKVLSYANNHTALNSSQSDVTTGIYTAQLHELLFGTDNAFDPATKTGVLGKSYLGTADHLFQFMDDPNDEHYGYYYYDSKLNAASYNQSQQRFYVYDYLERTSDSQKDGGPGEYSDFLPFNSPYANTNGKTVRTYTYAGEKNEYNGINHYMYDAKYNSEGSGTSYAGTNYWFGLSLDIDFYLPNPPGSGGNYDVYGNPMRFQFSGDDDVWVLIDGKLVLDLGGIHGVEEGDINFSTGVITVNGATVGNLSGVGEGNHILTVLYLERGSSQSNCAIYFNLAPRYELTIRKEDILTQDVLNGAQFSVYTDLACTQPAELWISKEMYHLDIQPQNTFTVTNGTATMWGFAAGKTYYIKETKPPDSADYGYSHGIIQLSLDHYGVATYDVIILPEYDENGKEIPPEIGFTVHGFKIDPETQEAYIIATNAPEWAKESTSLQVFKKWGDSADHSADYVTVYLTVTDPDGTVRRIRETVLGADNNWQYVWDNLPKYEQDGVTEIQYGVDEAYLPGYYTEIEWVTDSTIDTETFETATSFQNGKTYLLKSSSGYLSSVSEGSSAMLYYTDEATAKASPLAQWTATVSGNTVSFVNGAGQTLAVYYGNNSSNRYYYAATGSPSNSSFTLSSAGNNTYQIYIALGSWWKSNYYPSNSVNSSGRLLATTTNNSSPAFTPVLKTSTQTTITADKPTYQITNSPLDQATQLTVHKVWDAGDAGGILYEQEQVTIKLLANGVDTGRTVTLSLKNNWQDTFYGLPYTDTSGNVIVYTVEESWETADWIPSYGSIRTISGSPDTYETTVTNTYRWGYVYELPATGGIGTTPYTLGGLLLILSAGILLYNKIKRRKEET